MPILGKLIKSVHIYAGKPKTPETGGKHANKGIYSRTMYKSMFFRSLAAIRKRRKQTEANGNSRPPEHWTPCGNGRPKTDTNGRQPKVYIHSGNVGNAIPGSEKSAESVRS